MAIPEFVAAGTGVIVTTGSGAVTKGTVTTGNFIMLHVLSDGTGASPTIGSVSEIENLAGTGSAMSEFLSSSGTAPSGHIAVGSPTAATQAAWFGRATSDSISVSVTVNAGGDDCYCALYEFSGVASGTAVADVVENNAQADFSTQALGTSTTVADASVETLDADRLAINLVAINDDGTGIAAFTGASGGTWAMPTSFESSTGTDGTIALMTAGMAGAGTIDGGTATITSDAWGVVGFALISGGPVGTPTLYYVTA